MSAQDFETEYATLVQVDEAALGEGNEVTIRRAGGFVSTAGFRPEATESDAANPEAAEGYAEAPEAEPELWREDWRLVEGDDGRYGAPEVVIGPDDRVRVVNSSAWPWRVQGHLAMRFPDGSTFIGSGTMVNRHHVLTAGHCVYSAANGGWATSMTFEAARNDGNRPFGTVSAVRLLSVTGWTKSNSRDYDMGMVVLGSELGRQTGWFGVITGPDSLLARHRVNISGYPATPGGGAQLWTMEDAIKSVQAERLSYDLDTTGGQSGSGVWSRWAGHAGEYVAGIHTTGSPSGNGATRISRPKFDRIVDWMTNF